jgi:RND family efflux transporter MFP subunit
MKRLVRRLIIVAVLAAAAAGFYLYGEKHLWPPADNSTISAVGIIEAPEVNITSRIAGRIAELNLVEGDSVKRGQVVCRIEDVDLRNQLAHARAQLELARVNLADAQRTQLRDQRLIENHVISQKEYDDATTKVGQAQAAVSTAQADVRFYTDQLTDTQILAPADGVIVNKALEVGEWVTPGTTILTVDDLSLVWARIDVQETDLASLAVGQPATITLPTRPPSVLSGSIMSIGQEGEFATEHDVRRGRQDIRTFYVKVRILQGEEIAKPGMTAEVVFARRDGTAISSNPYRRPE